MAEKILALLVAFVGGAALAALIYGKLINLGLRHSAPIRKMLRDKLDREDARHALLGDSNDLFSSSFNAGVEAGERAGKCELCIDPIDKPHIEADGSRRWRACPNRATREVVDGAGRPLWICEEHFKKGSS